MSDAEESWGMSSSRSAKRAAAARAIVICMVQANLEAPSSTHHGDLHLRQPPLQLYTRLLRPTKPPPPTPHP
ncbi:hypothetical protein SNOG_07652 [Parastagonospora nodorum SN15]|uniref:Uncharacterized protein n=1 Tax=Phaeosphaeria nodorum (strain SN15 / ATCC MYA-4574 / FGSC 10173) TaxID=321614 RepID=Q0UKR2_PHANO|nr:hypothetical protein SNOG_07652 [Parastagonospora nodorum SN15]EAT85118.1 hypothetical protein SNOG_07652 [Parastagonospora nodorum SN15]